MTDTDKPDYRPTHEVMHIAGEGRKTRWTRIGAAWPHKDGEGYSLDIELMPVRPGRFALMKIKPQEGGSSDETPAR